MSPTRITLASSEARPPRIRPRTFTSEWGDGLVVVFISNPLNPRIVSGLARAGQTLGLAVAGDYVCLCGSQRFDVVDVSSPKNPRFVGGVDMPSYGSGITVSGNRAYLTGFLTQGPSDHTIIDMSYPHAPSPRGRVQIPRHSDDMTVDSGEISESGSHLYIGAAGLLVVDVADPDHPAIVGGETLYPASFVTTAGGMVLVGDDSLLVLPIQCETSAVGGSPDRTASLRLQVWPNPANSRMTLRCTLSAEGSAHAVVFNLAGRRVRSLDLGILSPGSHDITWDGRDDSGCPVASGLYLAKFSVGRETRSARVVVVR